METISEKEKLLRIIKRSKKKRKLKTIVDTKLKVNGVPSQFVADDIVGISYRGTPSKDVREALRKIVKYD